jgi:hypothetical protein
MEGERSMGEARRKMQAAPVAPSDNQTQRVNCLVTEFASAIKAHYLRDTTTAPDRVDEVLNALGVVAAGVVYSTGDPEAGVRLGAAFDMQMDRLLEEDGDEASRAALSRR